MKQLLLLLSVIYSGATAAQTLQINELMQSNVDCIMDDLNEFPDSWVELYNASSTAVNLQNYKLGISDDASAAWQLPDQTIAPKQHAVVYCDKVGEGLHTDYRLESGKDGCVYLFQGSTVIDQVTHLPKQPAPNIAYGRKTDGDKEWGYQDTPTPGAANCGKLCTTLLGDPVFSQEGKVMVGGKSFALTLSLPKGAPEGAVIRYTTNGAEPTRASTAYTTPITVSGTCIIRATVFCEGCLSPRSTCHSYIFFPRQLTLPVISIMTDDRYLNDPKIGIYVDGNYQSGKKNYKFNWRRPINIEYFETEGGQSQLNQLCETRIAGGATRDNMRKTLAVYANKRFGKKRLKYEFFPDQKPGLTDFKSIMLRNAGNDFDYLYMRDAIIQRTMASHVDLDWQAWRPAIIYINGQYKGLLNIRERSNEDNIYTNYDGLEDIDMFENWTELKEGDWENYNQFKAFYAGHGHTLAEYAEWMDWEEFINLMAMNLYYSNLDFPGNNITMWRPKEKEGKWRWIAKDTDFGMGLYSLPYNYNTLAWLHNPYYDGNHNWGANRYEATRLFRRLMEDEDFKNEFIDRTCIYMGDFLNERGTHEVWDPMYDMISYEYPYHRNLINQWWPNYNSERTLASNWIKNRTAEFYKQLGNFYQLGAPVSLIINKGTEDALSELTLNGIKLSRPVFDGKSFADRQITISGKAAEGREISGWQVISSTSYKVEGNTFTLQMPQAGNVTVRPVFSDASGIETFEHSAGEAEHTEVYDLQGRKVTNPQKGHLYIRNGKKYVER